MVLSDVLIRGIHNDDGLMLVLGHPLPAVDALTPLVLVQPMKAIRTVILAVQAWQFTVQLQQLRDPPLQLLLLRVLAGALPVDGLIIRPGLTDLRAHEQQRPAEHANGVHEQHSQLGVLALSAQHLIRCHLVNQALLLNVVVGEREDPPFVEGVAEEPSQLPPAEGLQLGPLPELGAEHGQSVMGEAHVPFQVEAQIPDVFTLSLCAVLDLTVRHPAEVCGLLRREQHPRVPTPDLHAEALQQRHPVLVQLALASHDLIAILFPPKVPVDDGRDRINP
mmetsp:Transcript_117514/g.279009  ORF Transcript_117514/g.279009 Transcript_117514/m.279009 type:complete len:278 (+) Transcript_117514:860-1693(+)